MGVSIYYRAIRTEPLSPAERLSIDEIVARYAVEDQIEEYIRSGSGFNWQSFCVYDIDEGTEPNTVLEGATGLPSNSDVAPSVGLRHWCKLLTEIRRKVVGCDWQVQVEDCEIKWDDKKDAFDAAL